MGVALEVETAVQELPHLFLAHQSPMQAVAVVVLRLAQPVLAALVGVVQAELALALALLEQRIQAEAVAAGGQMVVLLLAPAAPASSSSNTR